MKRVRERRYKVRKGGVGEELSQGRRRVKGGAG